MSLNLAKATDFCAGLPGAVVDLKWGADLCYCIGGRMFAVFQTRDGRTPCEPPSFKADAHRFLELTDRPGIVPAPYLARAKWVRITHLDAMPQDELHALLARSHALIAEKLTRKLRRELGIEP
jgi:predicted DNA-binding protein (MmcQ/YjbR family)